MKQECRDINAVHPVVRHLAQSLIETCHAQGIPVALGETYRSIARQDYLYAQGRTRPGAIVTYAQGKDLASYHQWHLDFDIFINQKGNAYNKELLAQAGRIGQSLGLEWGGGWKDFKDTPHFQYTQGLTIQQLKSGSQLQALLLQINGTLTSVRGIQIEGHNYVRLQDLRTGQIQIGYDPHKKIPTRQTHR